MTEQPVRPIAPGRAGWFVVFVLALANVTSAVDRQIINLLVDPIKADLGFSDVQISILQGFSFAMLYALLAVPLAWIADRHSRKWIIIAGLMCWSMATFGSGLANGFAALFLARMAVGVGEATLAPAGISILSDTFPRDRLPVAVSIMTGSGFAGSGLALVVGGWLYSRMSTSGARWAWLGDFEPWRLTFFTASILGLPILALLLMMRDPERHAGDGPPAESASLRRSGMAFSYIGDHFGLYAALIFGFSFLAAAQFGIGAWAPSYFTRVHGWSPEQVGRYFGLVAMLAGTAGVLVGGFVAERLLKRGMRDATLVIPATAVAIALPPAIAFPLVGSPWISLALLSVVLFFGAVPFGAGVATFPLVTPNRMRAQVIAVYLLVANLVGYSGGPLLVALLTDRVFDNPLAINLSLAMAPPFVMSLGLSLLLVSRTALVRKSEKESPSLILPRVPDGVLIDGRS